MEKSGNKPKPLPGNLPHVAYVLLWYPLFTQPFIFREVECLRQILPLKVYTLYGPNRRHFSLDMKNAPQPLRYGVRGLPEILWELIRQLCLRPGRLWKLFKRSCFHRWTNLEVFGENFWAFFVGLCLGRRFEEDGMDFVYAPWPRGAATAAWVGASIAGLPFATAARGDNLEPADPDFAGKLAAACFVRANNAADKARIEAFGNGEAKNKTRLVYNSLSLPGERGEGGRKRFCQKPFRLLALGRFDVTKGFDTLLKACAIMKDRGLDFRLTLGGGGGKVMGLGNQDKRLRNLRKSLGLEKEVNMPGLLSHDELPGILEEHDIFVAPCVIHSSGRRDGIPNTVIEAMRWGMPVASSNVNALPEIVREGQTGLCVEPNDPAALAEAIIWLCEHPEEAERMGRNGAELAAEMFDPMGNASRLAEIFTQARDSWGAEKNKCAE